MRTTSSTKLSTKIRWEEYGDNDFNEEHSEEEVSDILQRAGLPHAQRAKFTAEPKKEPYPEVKEPEGVMVKEGEKFGKHNKGRGGLPQRLVKFHTKRRVK